MAGTEPDILIGELLLTVPGGSDEDGRRVSEELVRQLRSLPPLPSPSASVTMPELNLDVRVRSGASPSEIGEAVARALHRALATAASSPPPAPAGIGGAESRTLLALADEPAAPAEPPPPTAPESDEGQPATPPPAPRPARPTTRRRPRPRGATGPDPGRGRMTVQDVPKAEILAQRLISGDLTPSDLAELFESLPPADAVARATALLQALEDEARVMSAPSPFPTTREIDEGLRVSRARPSVEQAAHQAATRVLAQERNRLAEEEIGNLTPVLRQGIIDGLPGNRITAQAWEDIKKLLLAQFGTMAKAEAFYKAKMKEDKNVFHRRVVAHQAMIDALKAAEAKLNADLDAEAKRTGNPKPEINVTIGGLVVRTIAGTQRLSLHAGGLAVDVLPSKNPMFKDKRFVNLKTAARIITGRERSLETFARLSNTSVDAEASGSADGDLLNAATELLDVTGQIEAALSSDDGVAKQIVAIVKKAGSEAEVDALAKLALPLVTTPAATLKLAIADFLKPSLPGPPSAQTATDIEALITIRQSLRGKDFFVLNLPAQFIVALMHPKGGNLRWLGAAHDRKDYMHFEVKTGRDLLKQ